MFVVLGLLLNVAHIILGYVFSMLFVIFSHEDLEALSTSYGDIDRYLPVS